jgi:hypothetical protein
LALIWSGRKVLIVGTLKNKIKAMVLAIILRTQYSKNALRPNQLNINNGAIAHQIIANK